MSTRIDLFYGPPGGSGTTNEQNFYIFSLTKVAMVYMLANIFLITHPADMDGFDDVKSTNKRYIKKI